MNIGLFGIRHRLQEAAPKLEGGGGGGGNGGAAPAEWLKPFGEHAKPFESFKEPAELATAWNETQTKLKTLESQADWRKSAATIDGKEDETIAKTLSRYTDLPSVAKALVEAQNKIRSGELGKVDLAKATPEQLGEYRKAHGVPEKVEGYFEKLPNGLVIGEVDKPMFDAFGRIAHEQNIPAPFVHAAAKWYYDAMATMQAEERRLDDAERLKVTQELRTLWGNDYQANENILGSWLDGMGAENKELFMNATLGDGTRMMNSRPVREFLAKMAREINPLGHVMPGADASVKSLQDEKAAIEKVMRDDRQRYNKDEKMQARYRDLIDAELKLNAKK